MPCSKMALTPFKGPEPAARLANSPMSQDPTRLQMVAQVQRLSGAQASFNFIQALFLKAGRSLLMLACSICRGFSQRQGV